MKQTSYDDSPTLYLIPTPIGNMDDVTYRTIKVFESVDVIFSEDTRVTKNLLSNFGISKKLIALHDHNEDIVKEKVLKYLEDGLSVGLVTDRGTPIISDPGYKTVAFISSKGYNIVSLPGATAFVPALTVSGLAPQPFLFYGFLNSKDSKRKDELSLLEDKKETIIFYEAPHRIISTLNMMLDIFGDRSICVARELTKKFETIYRGTISEVLKIIDVKGEFVIVVEGNKNNIVSDDLSIKENVDLYIKSGMDVMSAIKRVAKERKMVKNDVYMEYHKESE